MLPVFIIFAALLGINLAALFIARARYKEQPLGEPAGAALVVAALHACLVMLLVEGVGVWALVGWVSSTLDIDGMIFALVFTALAVFLIARLLDVFIDRDLPAMRPIEKRWWYAAVAVAITAFFVDLFHTMPYGLLQALLTAMLFPVVSLLVSTTRLFARGGFDKHARRRSWSAGAGLLVFYVVCFELFSPLGGWGMLAEPGDSLAESKRGEINSLGFRGPLKMPKKPADTYRIAMMGDSLVFGWGLAEAESVSRLLETRLDKRQDELTVEVFNAGVSSTRLHQTIQRLERKVLPASPDLVVLIRSVNDGNEFTGRTPQELLRDFVGMAREGGAQVLLCTYPSINSAGANEVVRSVAAADGIPMTDLEKALTDAKAMDEEHFFDNRHPNAGGHALIADILAREIESRYLGARPAEQPTAADAIFAAEEQPAAVTDASEDSGP